MSKKAKRQQKPIQPTAAPARARDPYAGDPLGAGASRRRRSALNAARTALAKMVDDDPLVTSRMESLKAGFPPGGLAAGGAVTRYDTWCDTCQDDDCGHVNVPIAAAADRTGEAVVAGAADTAAADAHRYQNLVARIAAAALELDDLRRRYVLTPAVIQAGYQGPACELHEAAGKHETPHTKTPTDVGGRLDEPRLLCQWCYFYVFDNGELPADWQVRDHVAGRQVRRPVKATSEATST